MHWRIFKRHPTETCGNSYWLDMQGYDHGQEHDPPHLLPPDVHPRAAEDNICSYIKPLLARGYDIKIEWER